MSAFKSFIVGSSAEVAVASIVGSTALVVASIVGKFAVAVARTSSFVLDFATSSLIIVGSFSSLVLIEFNCEIVRLYDINSVTVLDNW